MQTSGIKIDINSSDKLLFDKNEEVTEVVKFAVEQAVSKKRLERKRVNLKASAEKMLSEYSNKNE